MKTAWYLLAFCLALRVAPLIAMFAAGVIICYYALIGPPEDN